VPLRERPGLPEPRHPDLPDWQRAYYGANYPRLQRVKAAVNPADLLRSPQPVELPGAGAT